LLAVLDKDPRGYDLTFQCKLATQIQIGRREISLEALDDCE